MLFIFFLGNKLCDEQEEELKYMANKKASRSGGGKIKEQSAPGDAEVAEYNKG